MSRNVKGVNWGKMELTNEELQFTDKNQKILTMPNKRIQNSIANKQDINIEFNTDDIDDNEDMISNIKFFIPEVIVEKEKKEEGEEGEENKNEEEEDDKQQKNDMLQYVKDLNQQVLSKAKIGANSGDSIITFNDVQVTVPRGKYTVDFYKNLIRFHGTMYNYTIEYKHINRCFLLPLPDEVSVLFVISLRKPIKSGNTPHYYLVCSFKKEQEISIQLKIKEEDKEENGWQQVETSEPMEGPLNEVFATLFKQLIKVNIFVPGSFKSSDGMKGVNCNFKTNPGLMFPLQKSIIFVYKPVIYVPHNEIQVVEFDRIGAENKMFDIKIVTKTMGNQFMGFEKKELQFFLQYFKDRNVKIRKNDAFGGADVAQDNNDSEDLQQNKLLTAPRGDGKRQIKHQAVNNQLPDDDDEDDDSDFAGGDAASSDDEEDFDDEDDSNLAKMVEESDSENPKEKKKKKKNNDDDE